MYKKFQKKKIDDSQNQKDFVICYGEHLPDIRYGRSDIYQIVEIMLIRVQLN